MTTLYPIEPMRLRELVEIKLDNLNKAETQRLEENKQQAEKLLRSETTGYLWWKRPILMPGEEITDELVDYAADWYWFGEDAPFSIKSIKRAYQSSRNRANMLRNPIYDVRSIDKVLISTDDYDFLTR